MSRSHSTMLETDSGHGDWPRKVLHAVPAGQDTATAATATEEPLENDPLLSNARRSISADRSSQLLVAGLAICALVLGLTTLAAPASAIPGAGIAGAISLLRGRGVALIGAGAMLIALPLLSSWEAGPGFWVLFLFMLCAGLLPARFAPVLLRIPGRVWIFAATVCTVCFSLNLLLPGIAGVTAMLVGAFCAAFIGAGLARHLAMLDARVLAWGEDGLMVVTRDLLLGRITSGMLHDLSQPLNVISMANGNLSYIVEHLDIADPERTQLLERIRRISDHTEGTAAILNLFRWFGREGNPAQGQLNVRSALERAVAGTKSNVYHHDVQVTLRGNALDHLVPGQHHALEIMAVAALLSAFGAFGKAGGERKSGAVVLSAEMSPAHVIIRVQCVDEAGMSLAKKSLDHATLWLVEQIAFEINGDFRCLGRGRDTTQYLIRLARDDI
ncbi:hypothetical protein [Novosphingobium sp. PP1Y]|uniref:hypothetical protein n=1 Tax=Novosphingobium sp. PP1Y TaxID=702113 RepID=UPI00030EE143|nr:hypothetical protein [Novosphingobium sp. PP1Y]